SPCRASADQIFLNGRRLQQSIDRAPAVEARLGPLGQFGYRRPQKNVRRAGEQQLPGLRAVELRPGDRDRQYSLLPVVADLADEFVQIVVDAGKTDDPFICRCVEVEGSSGYSIARKAIKDGLPRRRVLWPAEMYPRIPHEAPQHDCAAWPPFRSLASPGKSNSAISLKRCEQAKSLHQATSTAVYNLNPLDGSAATRRPLRSRKIAHATHLGLRLGSTVALTILLRNCFLSP